MTPGHVVNLPLSQVNVTKSATCHTSRFQVDKGHMVKSMSDRYKVTPRSAPIAHTARLGDTVLLRVCIYIHSFLGME